MRERLIICFVIGFTAAALPFQPASADRCVGSGGFVNVVVGCVDEEHGDSPGTGSGTATGTSAGTYTVYWVAPACPGSSPGVVVTDATCGFFQTCGSKTAGRYFIWAREVRNNNPGPWTFVGARCLPLGSEGQHISTATPQVTWQMVLEAVRKVGLPSVAVQVQPDDKTLVNFDTIFYAKPSTFVRSLQLLGRDVDVQAEPREFRWAYGDGTFDTTTRPGEPYPAKTIVHQYSDAHVTVHPSVDVVYTVRFRVSGGDWQDIPETVTIPGPSTALRIQEARPVLSGGHG